MGACPPPALPRAGWGASEAVPICRVGARRNGQERLQDSIQAPAHLYNTDPHLHFLSASFQTTHTSSQAHSWIIIYPVLSFQVPFPNALNCCESERSSPEPHSNKVAELGFDQAYRTSSLSEAPRGPRCPGS